MAAIADPAVKMIIGVGCSICMKKNWSEQITRASTWQIPIADVAISTGKISVFPVNKAANAHVVPNFDMKNKIGKM